MSTRPERGQEPPAGKLGVFVIGARGSVAATAFAGARAIAADLQGETGMVTALPELAALPLVRTGDLEFCGYELRRTSLIQQAGVLAAQGAIPPALLPAIAPALEEIEARIRPGHLHHPGDAIAGLADAGYARRAASPRQVIDDMRGDLEEMATSLGVRRMIVVNLASTEPANGEATATLSSLERLDAALQAGGDAAEQVPLSTLYAYAAIDSGSPYVNFTPSLGASCPALEELAVARGVPHAGRDGKTGETLLKTVLAPMFVARHLELVTWQGYNMLGNSDGAVLREPSNLQSKVTSKDIQLKSITGKDDVHTTVRIDYVPGLGEWKTAWDFIQFRGFLGTLMELNFTWRGCDSTLAAPLVLDLVRLADLAASDGARGALAHLAAFFKNPVGVDMHDFGAQMGLLLDHARERAGRS